MTAPFFYKPRPMVGPYGLFILRLRYLWERGVVLLVLFRFILRLKCFLNINYLIFKKYFGAPTITISQ